MRRFIKPLQSGTQQDWYKTTEFTQTQYEENSGNMITNSHLEIGWINYGSNAGGEVVPVRAGFRNEWVEIILCPAAEIRSGLHRVLQLLPNDVEKVPLTVAACQKGLGEGVLVKKRGWPSPSGTTFTVAWITLSLFYLIEYFVLRRYLCCGSTLKQVAQSFRTAPSTSRCIVH